MDELKCRIKVFWQGWVTAFFFFFVIIIIQNFFYDVNERKICISLYGSLLGKAANEQIFQEVDPQKNIVDR